MILNSVLKDGRKSITRKKETEETLKEDQEQRHGRKGHTCKDTIQSAVARIQGEVVDRINGGGR